MNPKFLIVLSPPRSFSSVVATMIGQHPELYGFPELHLFIGDTVHEVLDRELASGNYLGPPGLIRSIAELQFGRQTNATCSKAAGWLDTRRHWSTKKLMDHLRSLVDPLIGMEKSPVTALKAIGLERAYAFYPDAYYLHLTRHPLSTRRSLDIFIANRRRMRGNTRERAFDNILSWYRFHKNIMDFTQTLPPGQTMRIKGEDVLSEPDLYLPQLAAWIGIRTDAAAIDAMKHPELSPYAYRGPAPAHGGNDGNFMRNPALRPGRIKEPNLQAFWAEERVPWVAEADRQFFVNAGFDIAPNTDLMAEMTGMANALGYH